MGLQLLLEAGPNALTIERLCNGTGRSKGSFYFHFTSVDDYKGELLAHWEKTHTQDVGKRVAEHTQAAARRRALPRLVADLDNRVERAIRMWAEVDDKAKLAIARTDARRINFVAEAIVELEDVDPIIAHRLATIEYAAFLGFQYLLRNTDPAERLDLYEATHKLISALPANPES